MRTGAAGLLASGVVVAAVLVVATWSHPAPTGFNGSAAQSNLQNALTGARSYYIASGDTFLGLTDSAASGPSSLQEIGTGLSYVIGGPSTGTHVVSVSVGGGGSYVILVDYYGLYGDCMGILDLTHLLPRAVVGIGKSVGTYFFVIRHTSSSGCNAARVRAASASFLTGFPRP